MTWSWRLEHADGTPAEPVDGADRHASQADAESWLGENWRELLDRGVATATLFDGEDEVYGPMGLAAP
jgi:hypothetical protein